MQNRPGNLRLSLVGMKFNELFEILIEAKADEEHIRELIYAAKNFVKETTKCALKGNFMSTEQWGEMKQFYLGDYHQAWGHHLPYHIDEHLRKPSEDLQGF